MKSYQYSREKLEPCYYCGAPGTSGEHAPPEMMFKGFGCSFIIVPSCDNHNSKKSGDDLAIVAAYIEAIDGMIKDNTIAAGHLPKDVQIAVKRAVHKKWFENAKNKVRLHPYIEGRDDIVLPRFVSDFNIYVWMRQLTAALVWSATGYYDREINWNKASVFSAQHSPESEPKTEEEAVELYIKNASIENTYNTLFTWSSGWSSYPNSYPPGIYNFQVSFLPDPSEWHGKEVIFRHQFYRQYNWYVGFAASTKTKQILRQRTQ